MPTISKAKDEKLIEALAKGSSISEVAKIAGVSRPTVYSRLADRTFQQAVIAMRREIKDAALGKLTYAAVSAAETLEGLLAIPTGDDAPPPPSLRVQMAAARSILELGLRLQNATELEERIARLEKQAEQGVLR